MQDFQQENEANIIDSPPTWLARNKAPVIAGTLLVLAIAVGTAAWQGRRITRESQANAALDAATTLEAKLSLARQYLGTEASALTLLSAATLQFEEKNYSGASETYALFLSNYPHHLLANSARLGQANAWEAAGKIDEALSAYIAVGTHNPPDNYTPVGLIEAARLYRVKKNYASARQLLSDCVRDYKNSFYGQQAAEELKSLPQS